ncbi:2,3-diketo-L-gulonate-binding periplasmic protein YiaO precursor [Anaerotignum neopropionicum]|uniref:2,3-diketo-L-gulonate-binding periplasmic protein YiaO n=1 Tax=Anaerotignum neopropionicum TaxID=36847 RepID=A0A136WEA9_9FIRM|nr:DctP family TRAP transporter solute-binding subunit [Anaerotignum neopropionicum]KXL52773.1 2,3-diketo-L-gulonate-binding periplasmic protein YiaO precursor [Anaerotignum neopropionicum]
MLKFKKGLAMALASVLTVAMVTGCGGSTPPKDSGAAGGENTQGSEETVELVFSNVTSVSGKDAGEVFKRVAEEESGGSVVVNLFPDNMLGDDRVVIETTAMGNIDIGVSSTSPLATMYPDFYLFDSPYLFLNSQDAYAKLDGEVGQQILDGMESIGLKGLAFWENGFRNFTNNKIAVKTPADVKGFKVRTMENEVHIAAWTAFGANPTPMAFTELFTALQQGTVDAQENPLGIIDANKFVEVQKYVSLTQHVYTPYIVCMNLDKFNSLSENQQNAILKAAAESTSYQRERSQELEKEILEKFAAGGTTVVELTDVEKAEWQKVVADNNIFDLVKKKMGHPDYLDAMLAE